MRLTWGLAEREKDTQIAQRKDSIMSFLKKPALSRDDGLMYECYLRINQHLWVISLIFECHVYVCAVYEDKI